MENNSLLSIIVPVYKTEAYLRRCMDSLCGQTYNNIEIIAVNDGSPDNCLEILKEYAAKDNRVIVLDKENGGANSARNMALFVAKGEWISFVDSDDWLDLTYFQELMNYSNCKNQLICGGFRLNENGTIYKVPQNSLEFDRINSINILYNTYYGMLYNVWGKVFKKDIILNNKLLFRSFLRDDGIFLLDYYQYINNISIISTSSFIHYNTENINSNTHKMYGIEKMMLDLYKYHNAFAKIAETDYPNYDRYMHILNIDKTKSYCDILHETYSLPYKEKRYWYKRMIYQLPEFTLSQYLNKPIHKWLKIAFKQRSSFMVTLIIYFQLLRFKIMGKLR